MLEHDTPAPGDTGEHRDPAHDTAGDDTSKGLTIPKARLDQEIAKRRAVESELDAVATALEVDVPDEYKELIPSGLSAAERIKWIRTATAKGIFSPAPPLSTHQSKPRLVKPASNPDALSPMQKMASGYGRQNRE